MVCLLYTYVCLCVWTSHLKADIVVLENDCSFLLAAIASYRQYIVMTTSILLRSLNFKRIFCALPCLYKQDGPPIPFSRKWTKLFIHGSSKKKIYLLHHWDNIKLKEKWILFYFIIKIFRVEVIFLYFFPSLYLKTIFIFYEENFLLLYFSYNEFNCDQWTW